jgi:histidinol phosphatase-like PHP family hydrolase
MRITTDWHIHSHNSCDSACMQIADLIPEAAAKGITDFGVTDHYQNSYNMPDIESAREEFLALNPGPRFHFGIEVSSVSTWELEVIAGKTFDSPPIWGIRDGGPEGAEPTIGLTLADIDRLGIEYVIGGTHWPLYVPFEREAIIHDYHRQNMMLATHPLVDIVAHPWWWMGHWADENGAWTAEPWFDDFTVIPQSMHTEFADAVIESGSVVEINPSAIAFNKAYPESFAHQYLDYLALLKERGVTFSMGGDCHSAHYDIDFDRIARWIEPLGLRDEDFWRPPPRTE